MLTSATLTLSTAARLDRRVEFSSEPKLEMPLIESEEVIMRCTTLTKPAGLTRQEVEPAVATAGSRGRSADRAGVTGL